MIIAKKYKRRAIISKIRSNNKPEGLYADVPPYPEMHDDKPGA
ncbi:Uncharacterised protein [uncultured archaeon]|nr:Uncharacterised protein [uncultured archaeon]